MLFCPLICLLSSCSNGGNKTTAATPFFDSIINKSEHLRDSGNKKEALRFLIAAHANDNTLSIADQMNYYVYISQIYREDLHDNNYVIAYADSMLRTLEENNETRAFSFRYAQAYNMKADALFAMGLYDESYNAYFNAKKIAQDNADSCSLSQYSYSLGMVLFKQQRYDGAVRCFLEAFAEVAPCKDNFLYFYRRQELLDNIGLCYDRTQKPDSAMYFYKKTLAFIDSNYMRYDKREDMYISAKAVVYGNMADLFIAKKDYDSAEILLKKSIGINIQKGYSNEDAIVDQVKLAGLYMRKDAPAEVKETLDEIKAELDTIPDKQVERSWNKLMWQYYNRQQDSIRAYRYLLTYQAMNDSFVSKNKPLMATDLDEQVRNIEKQYQIRLLNKNNEEEKIYVIIASLIAIMALAIVGLVSRNAARNKKNVKMLTSLNSQVIEQKEKLELAIAELELKDRDKSRILRSVAHDVMNPIAAIMSLTDILANESVDYTADQKEILKMIKEACTNSLNLSKDILETASSIEKAKIDIPKEWVDINKLVNSCAELLNINAATKKQRILVTHTQKDVEAYVNKEKIWRIINNLISNAIKFSYKNSEIGIAVESFSGIVHIMVTDQGIGISEKNKSRVFETFTEAKITGTSGEQPHGLGLSISLQLARAHNGNLWFESEEGKGTTFHLEFPVNANSNN